MVFEKECKQRGAEGCSRGAEKKRGKNLLLSAIPKKSKISSSQIGLVIRRGKKLEGKFFYLKYLWSPNQKENFFGFVVASRISKKATIRNKIKRRAKAIVQKLQPEFKRGNSAVLVAKQGIVGRSYSELKKDIETLLKYAQII